jgi:hypothetical protein
LDNQTEKVESNKRRDFLGEQLKMSCWEGSKSRKQTQFESITTTIIMTEKVYDLSTQLSQINKKYQASK